MRAILLFLLLSGTVYAEDLMVYKLSSIPKSKKVICSFFSSTIKSYEFDPFVVFNRSDAPEFYIFSDEYLGSTEDPLSQILCRDDGGVIQIEEAIKTQKISKEEILIKRNQLNEISNEIAELNKSAQILRNDIEFIAKLDEFIKAREEKVRLEKEISSLEDEKARLTRELSVIKILTPNPKFQARLREQERAMKDLG